MFGDWWIDDMGKWRAAELPGQRHNVAVPIGADMREQHTAYRQLGLVKALLTPTTITFRWDVWHASSEAIESMIDFLEIDKQPRRIVLDFFYGGWITETFYVPTTAIKRIRQADLYRSIELIDTVFVQEQNLESIKTSSDVIRRGFEYFDRVGHLFEVSDENTFKSLYSKALVYTSADGDASFLRLHVGENAAFARVTNAMQSQLATPKSGVSFRPCDRYSKQISAAYAEVLSKREPRLHHVRALFRKEGCEPVWVPYQRLLLPSTLSDGTPVFVCLSDITDNIRIPFLQPYRHAPLGASGI